MKKETRLVPPTEENGFLSVYPLIHRIALRQLNHSFQDSAEDIAQRVMLKLWHWNVRRHRRWERNHFKNKAAHASGGGDNNNYLFEDCRPLHELSADEWQRLANRAARNEIKSFFAAKDKKEVPLDTGMSDEGYFPTPSERAMNTQPIEGNSKHELKSELCQIWKAFGILSIREKYALLLRERTFINYLIVSDCCKIKQITDCLELTREEFIKVYKQMPLGDHGIALLLSSKLGQAVSPINVTKARQRAKRRIRSALKYVYKTGNNSGRKNGKAFNERKT